MQRDGKRGLAPKVGQNPAFIAGEVVVNGLSPSITSIIHLQ